MCLMAGITYEVIPGWAVHWSDVGLQTDMKICFIFESNNLNPRTNMQTDVPLGSNMYTHKNTITIYGKQEL